MAAFISKSATTATTVIPVTGKKKYYALSSSQKRLYFLYEMDKYSLAYNMPQFVKLEGRIDRDKFNATFSKLISRHASLRTVFTMVDNMPFQEVKEEIDFEMEWHIRKNPGHLLESFIKPFDLNNGPLLRAMLVSVSEIEHILAVDMHHIITDGLSNSILIADFMKLYVGAVADNLPLTYADYAEWQQQQQQQQTMLQQKQFWLAEYAEEINHLFLPSNKQRPAVRSHEGSTLSFCIGQQETAALQRLVAEEGTTMYTVLLSVFSLMLAKLGTTEDVVIGTPVSGRAHADLEGIIGMFANTLPVRTLPVGNKSYRAFLKELQSKTIQCFEYQGYQYEELIRDLKISRDTSRNPLFDVLFVYENFEGEVLHIPGMTISAYNSTHDIAKFDLTLSVMNKDTEILLNMNYSTAVFSSEDIERFIGYFKRIVTSVVGNKDIVLHDIELLDADEKAEQLRVFNDTAAPYFKEGTIIDLFENQARKTPGKEAIKCGAETVSYSDFSKLSGKFSAYLQAKAGVKPGQLVGILLEREVYLMVSVFGILKAGAAYVPIDPSFPVDRINSIIADSGITALVTRSRYVEKGIKIEKGLINLDDCREAIEALDATNVVDLQLNPRQLAYVIYTSGSTGKPKGVMIEHHSLVNRLQWMQKLYPLKESDVILQKTPVVFDVSVWELFWWSFTGASVYLLQPGAEKEPDIIIDTISANSITTMHFVPSMLQAFLPFLSNVFDFKKLSSLQKVFSSGEALKPEQVDGFGATLNKYCNTRLINLYGPTEATVDVSFHEIDFAKNNLSIPIGKPIDNTRFYILDKYNRLVPRGSVGQLFIAGAGLARGYLKNEALTAEKFISNPYCKEELIYNTGDLAKWLNNGEVEYLGRSDQQVKIRGFRIDCGEIESQLNTYPAINESTVLMAEKDNNKYLVAYFTALHVIDAQDLRNHLSAALPSYMVPVHYVQLQKFPLTTSGKLNRKALPAPVTNTKKGAVKPVSGEIAEKLIAIWSELLGIEKELIGADDNFFDIGGHSINILTLSRIIGDVFHVQLSVATMFSLPTIKSIEAYLQKGSTGTKAMSDEISDLLNEAELNLNTIAALID